MASGATGTVARDMQDFDAQIAEATARREAFRPSMTQAYEVWLEQAAPWFAEYWQEHAREIVSEQGELAQQLAQDGTLARARGALNDLVANAKDEVDRAFGPSVWPHSTDKTDWWKVGASDYFHSGFRNGGNLVRNLEAPRALEESQRKVLALAAKRLRDFGFKPLRTTTSDARMDTPMHGELYIFPRQRWTQPMADAMGAYADLHEQAIKLTDEIDTLEKQKARTIAGNLWDEA